MNGWLNQWSCLMKTILKNLLVSVPFLFVTFNLNAYSEGHYYIIKANIEGYDPITLTYQNGRVVERTHIYLCDQYIEELYEAEFAERGTLSCHRVEYGSEEHKKILALTEQSVE